MGEFSGKSVLVTGAGSGIGRACAHAFAQAGAHVIAVDLDPDAAASTVASIRQACTAHAGATKCHLDITDESAVRAAMAGLLAQHRIDILVNSAGVGAVRDFLQTEMALLDRLIAVNLRGTFLCGQIVAQSMVDRGVAGVIVNIGSASGARGNAGRAAYGATKAAVENLTQVMAVELASRGIRVNAVAPGPIETPLVRAVHSPEVRQAWLSELPVNRYGSTDDVAQAVLYLASDRASYINGHVLYVDGGFHAAGIMASDPAH